MPVVPAVFRRIPVFQFDALALATLFDRLVTDPLGQVAGIPDVFRASSGKDNGYPTENDQAYPAFHF